MLDIVTWITETFHFFVFLLSVFYFGLFLLLYLQVHYLYLLQCLMSDCWQNLAEKSSFQKCYLLSQKVAHSWSLCCCLFLFHYVHNFLCLNLYTYNNFFKVLVWTSAKRRHWNFYHFLFPHHKFTRISPGVGDGQGILACCSWWGCKEADTTERLNWTELKGSRWEIRGITEPERGTEIPPPPHTHQKKGAFEERRQDSLTLPSVPLLQHPGTRRRHVRMRK